MGFYEAGFSKNRGKFFAKKFFQKKFRTQRKRGHAPKNFRQKILGDTVQNNGVANGFPLAP
jgi:hypothetical protein